MITSAHIKTVREGLGLTAAELAEALETTERSVFNWEAGSSSPRRTTLAKLEQLQDQAAAEVAEHLEIFTAEGKHVQPVLVIEGPWAGWQRAIAFRVLQSLPDLQIVEADHDQA